MYIGKNISVLRKGKGLNQTALGELMGKKKEAISAYETQRNFPDFDGLLKLCEIFNVSLDDLVFKNMEEEGVMHVSEPKVPYTEEEKDKAADALFQAMKAKAKMYADIINRIDPDLLKELDDL